MASSFTIITVVRNNPLVAEAVNSILTQRLQAEVESIVIDGASTDNTLAALAAIRPGIAKLVSEPDKGIYDAMNKGIRLATGDIVGLLNADDLYQDDQVLARIAKAFEDPTVHACYGDLVYVRRDDPSKIVRYWRSGPPASKSFRWGWMPAHPTFFVRRSVYERYGLFDTRYMIAADFELMLRLLAKHQVRTTYIPQVLVRMRTGGASGSGPKAIWDANWECRQAFKNLGLPCGPLFTPFKLARHGAQLFRRPPQGSFHSATSKPVC